MLLQPKDTASDLDASLSRNAVSKDLKVLKNSQAIMQHIELLLMMDEQALIGNPHVCAGLRNLVFEKLGEHEVNIVKSRIALSLSHEPRIIVNDITVEISGHDLDIRVDFTFRDTDEDLVYTSTLRRVI